MYRGVRKGMYGMLCVHICVWMQSRVDCGCIWLSLDNFGCWFYFEACLCLLLLHTRQAYLKASGFSCLRIPSPGGNTVIGLFCKVWVFKLSLMLARPVLDTLSHIPSPCISFINVINEDFRVDRNEGLLGFWWWS